MLISCAVTVHLFLHMQTADSQIDFFFSYIKFLIMPLLRCKLHFLNRYMKWLV